MKTQEIRSRLFCTLLLGFAAGFVLGAIIVLVMQEVLGDRKSTRLNSSH